MGDMMAMGWWMLIWSLVGVAVLVAVIYAVVRLAQQSTIGGQRGGDDAEDLLRRRYAAGEIDREEYLRRQADLRPR